MVKVFVYGTLKRGRNNNYLLNKSQFLGVFITEKKFNMYDGLGFPYVLLGGYNSVVGELYEVDEDTLDKLDFLEGVRNDHYKRTQVKVSSATEEHTAWIYVATNSTAEFVRDHYMTQPTKEKYGLIVQEW